MTTRNLKGCDINSTSLNRLVLFAHLLMRKTST
nr:MAG TPA: hypothetical protein [Caudoviricetes sp.]